jgi:alpha-tubulin suppressor-like RCC1 family protein
MRATAVLGAVLATLAGALAAPAQATLVGWGFNRHGELGGGFSGRAHLPVSAPPSIAGAVQVVSSWQSSYALMGDGTVWAWGQGWMGQLGNGERGTELAPVQVQGLTGVKQIAAGDAHVIALLSDGRVATWGGNMWGTLGNGTSGNGSAALRFTSDVPVYLGVHGAVAVAAGGADDAVLLADGTVLAWGENTSGQLGDGTKTAKDVPTPVPGLVNVRALAIGGSSSHGGHILALLSDGTVRSLGSNSHGELGDGTTTERHSPVRVLGVSGAVAISTSLDHSMALLANGSVVAWGADSFGQLGVRPTQTCSKASLCVPLPTRTGVTGTAISAGRLYSLVLSGGQLLAFGCNRMLTLGRAGSSTTKPVLVPGLSHVSAFDAGEFHALAVGTFG